jgi:hypothetical protein
MYYFTYVIINTIWTSCRKHSHKYKYIKAQCQLQTSQAFKYQTGNFDREAYLRFLKIPRIKKNISANKINHSTS